MSPLLFQFHDIINKGDTEELIEAVEQDLTVAPVRSWVFDPKQEFRMRLDNGRNSFDKFLKTLPDNQNSASRRLTRRIRHITKLDPAGTPYRLASYTYGGTFDIHHDAVS